MKGKKSKPDSEHYTVLVVFILSLTPSGIAEEIIVDCV